MSRLSEILNVEEGQEFQYENDKFKVVKNIIFILDIDGLWQHLASAHYLMQIIASPEKIKIIPTKPRLTEQQVTAIKGRIAEGWKYIAKDLDGEVVFFEIQPEYYKKLEYFDSTGDYSIATLPIYNFLKPGECVYLPDLIGDEEK